MRGGTLRATPSRCREHLEGVIFRCTGPKESASDVVHARDQIGIELEMLPLARLPSGRPRGVPLAEGESNLASFLRPAARRNGWKWIEPGETETERSDAGVHRIDLPQGGRITFEPGGQLEYSGDPAASLKEALLHLSDAQALLRSILEPHGVELLQIGLNPWHTVREIGLQLSRSRYLAMDSYFSSLGPYGRRMMRQSCSMQVNLDWGPDESTLVKRYVAAQLIAPFATAIFGNSPFRDGRPTRMSSFRAFIWQRMDHSRTGFPDIETITRSMTREACVDSYLEFALGAGVIDAELPGITAPRGMRFADWMERSFEGSLPSLGDFETHLSLLFPEVRPRGFMEMRSVDCQAVPWQQVPPAFFVGLVYDSKTLEQVIALLIRFQGDLDRVWAEATLGLEKERVRTTSQRLMALATQGLGSLPGSFGVQQAAEDLGRYRAVFTERGRCPADDLRDAWAVAGELRPAAMKKLETEWASRGP